MDQDLDKPTDENTWEQAWFMRILETVPEAFWLNDVSLMYPIKGPSFPEPGNLHIRDFTGFRETFSRL